jgi:hypothetical protein
VLLAVSLRCEQQVLGHSRIMLKSDSHGRTLPALVEDDVARIYRALNGYGPSQDNGAG